MSTASSPFTLPNWMQPQYRALDWGLLLMLLLALLAALPFVARPGLPRETDAELHVFRTAELMNCLHGGALYPRWAPNFWYGYGYPFFNYYGSFTYYLASGVGLLTGEGPVLGARVVFALGQVVAGLGTFAFVRRRWNAAAGFVAGMVYAYSPYIVLIDPHLRGDMAEAFALGLLPAILWAFDRVLSTGRGYTVLLAAGLLAALVFTHNLMALVGFALLAGWLVWLRALARPPHAAAHWRLTWLTLVLGVLLASFFWLPVFLESGAVQLDRLVGPGHFDYRNHFLELGELLAPSLPVDFGAANPAYRFNLGVVTWVMALAGGLALLRQMRHPPASGSTYQATLDEWRRRFARGETGELTLSAGAWRDATYFGAVGLALIFLMLPASGVVWETVPLLALLQFPWRLLGAASLCLAVLAGAATRWLSALRGPAQAAAFGMMVALPMMGALPVLYPPPWPPDFGETTPQAYLDFELSGVALGTTSGGEYLPQTVLVPPGPQPSLIESYAGPGPVDKVNRTTLPPGTQVDVVHHGPMEDQFLVQGQEAFLLRLYTFAFPGWRVEIDGRPAAYEIGSPEGFIVVPVPAGTHQVRVFFSSTPTRIFANSISVLALVGLGGVYALALRRSASFNPPRPLLNRHMTTAAAAAVALFVGVKLAADRQPGLFYLHTPPGETPTPAQYAHRLAFEDGVELLAYDLPRASARPGETLEVTLYWHILQSTETNYQVFVHLAPLGGPKVPAAQSDKLNPGDYPTSRWTPAHYVRDAHVMRLPADIPPGDYLLSFGLYDMHTDTRVTTERGEDQGILPIFIHVW